MKVPLSWLKEYLDLNLTPTAIADTLTLGGLEVEKIDQSSDPVFEIALTPNLGHAMSILGVARELAALLNLKLKAPAVDVVEDRSASIHQMIHVEIQDRIKCPRYACRAVQGVKLGPAPAWLKHRLEACGLRSINNLVDVGNYVMLELGQPLHIFDYDLIEGQKIIVSSATPYRSLTTLDEKNREIPSGALLICDPHKPLAFAGIMGGAATAVSEKTQTVLIEAAHFTPVSIRKTSKDLNLRTESSQRFERGTDPSQLIQALDLAAVLLQKCAGGKIAQGLVDCKERGFSEKHIDLRVKRTNRMLGTELSMSEMVFLLERLQIKITAEEKDLLKTAIPLYRNDLQTEIDLIEEIGRIYGYNNIPQKSARHISSITCHAPIFEFENKVRDKLVSEGLQEFLTCDLISPALAELALEQAESADTLIQVLQPSSIDQSVLRPALFPGLLQALKFNIDHQNQDLSAFEVGRIHFKDRGHYKEQAMAAIVLSGRKTPYHWSPPPAEVDFFDLKGLLENIFEALKIPNLNFEVSHLRHFHPFRQARIKSGAIPVGVIGEIHPSHINALDLSQRVLLAELNLHDLLPLQLKHWQVSELPAYPASQRDWTLTLPEQTPIGQIFKVVRELNSPLLEKMLLLDLYHSEQIGKDRKNATFRFVYRDLEKTIAMERVEAEHARIMQAVSAVF